MDKQKRLHVFTEIEWQGIIEQLSIPHQQSEVLKQLFCGHSDKQIASEMDIALPTVRTYLHRLFERFDVQDRHELILYIFNHFRKQCYAMQKCPMEDFYRNIERRKNIRKRPESDFIRH